MTDPADSATAATLAERTLAHYERNAQSFWEGTSDHDVSQNRDALIAALAPAPGTRLRLLDFGCGPGRDLAAFRALGHEAVGLDGCARFCAMARDHSGCEVWQQDFLALDLPSGHFDGVFANASLFHVPGEALDVVLRALHDTLRPGGVLLASNPRGDNQEGFSGQRWGAFWNFETWCQRVEATGLVPLDHYYRPPGRPRAEQPWLVTLWQRPAKSAA